MGQIDDAFILAAGHGKRMQPYTIQKPKPMLMVDGQPMIGRSIEKLESYGVNQITVNTHYKAEQIHNYLRGFTKSHIHISHEEALLDTGGGIKNALPNFEGRDFFVLSGDSYWEDAPDISCLQLLQEHWNPVQMDILMLLQDVRSMHITEAIGDYDLDPNGQAIRSLDKSGNYMFTSIRINKSGIFEDVSSDAFSYLDLMDKAQEQGRLHGIVNPGQWYHISTPKDLDDINAYIQNSQSPAEKEKAV